MPTGAVADRRAALLGDQPHLDHTVLAQLAGRDDVEVRGAVPLLQDLPVLRRLPEEDAAFGG